ncbi:MAG: SufE family protein [Cyanobacteria bacterium KgW148]|nr:SufE family protein [Cyanobacteria bacterium KgW148]
MPTTALPPSLVKLIDRFQTLSDPKARYEQLILYGKKLPPFDPALKIPENRVQGCVSNVFLTATLNEGKVTFNGDSDALISKGFLGFLAMGMNDLSPAEILKLTPDFVQELGLAVSLTPSRSNGFVSIFQTMQRKTIELTS